MIAFISRLYQAQNIIVAAIMKIMITTFFWGMVLLSCIPFQLCAQGQKGTSSSVNINVNARIIESINLSTIRNMGFGDVQPGQQTIDISPITNPNAGKMVASGIADARIRVSFLREWQLTSEHSDNPLTFYYRVAGSIIDDQTTAELLQIDNRDLRFNGEGKFYFWIGGRVDITNASPGNYEGEFTIEIEYI